MSYYSGQMTTPQPQRRDPYRFQEQNSDYYGPPMMGGLQSTNTEGDTQEYEPMTSPSYGNYPQQQPVQTYYTPQQQVPYYPPVTSQPIPSYSPPQPTSSYFQPQASTGYRYPVDGRIDDRPAAYQYSGADGRTERTNKLGKLPTTGRIMPTSTCRSCGRNHNVYGNCC